MADLRDYEAWHRAYDDPDSSTSWRLRTVQGYLHAELDRRSGPVRVVSSCAGDGRDVLEVVAGRDDADRVSVTLLEIHPELTRRARDRAAAAGLRGVDVRTVDAGWSDAYAGAVPADIVLLVGIFGNISAPDVERTVRFAPQVCAGDSADGATVIWSRGRSDGDLNGDVRRWFGEAGFTELAYETRDAGSRPALGVVSFRGPSQPLSPGRRLFTFVR